MEGTDRFPLISVIVPIYNVVDYLQRCVDSIRKQSYRNLEIILVDDGSTDNSGAMAEKEDPGVSQGKRRFFFCQKFRDRKGQGRFYWFCRQR